MKTLILGIGNLLLSDEGVGVRAIEALESRWRFPPHITLMDGGTAGMELMEAIASCQLLIVVDAVRADYPPGCVFVLEDDEVPALFTARLSPHQLGLSDVLMALKLTGEYPEKLFLVGITPESLEPGMTLTTTGHRAMECALKQVMAILERLEIIDEPLEEIPCLTTA